MSGKRSAQSWQYINNRDVTKANLWAAGFSSFSGRPVAYDFLHGTAAVGRGSESSVPLPITYHN